MQISGRTECDQIHNIWTTLTMLNFPKQMRIHLTLSSWRVQTVQTYVAMTLNIKYLKLLQSLSLKILVMTKRSL